MEPLPPTGLRDWTLRGVRLLDPATGRDEACADLVVNVDDLSITAAARKVAAVVAP